MKAGLAIKLAAICCLPFARGVAAQVTLPITTCGPVVASGRVEADLVTVAPTCLTVLASGITIDGAGHRITAGQFAIQWSDQSAVTVKNVVSDQGLQIYGPAAHHNLVTDSTFGKIAVYRGDDNTIQNSRMARLVVSGQYNDPVQRTVISGNVIEGTLATAEEKLVLLYTGPDGGTEPDGTVRCGVGAHTFTNNTLTGTVANPVIEPELLHIKCGKGSTIRGNTVRSAQRAVGILLRDGADDNVIEDNDVRIGDGNEGALLIQSGTAGYHHPRDNTFSGNVFRADRGRVFWLEAAATRGNVFSYNLFRNDAGTIESVRLTDGPGVTTRFDHNTFYRASSGPVVIFRDLGPGAHNFTSNIFLYVGNANGIFDVDKAQSLAAYRGDYNVFWDPSAWVAFTSFRVDLGTWKYFTGQDVHSVQADPRFVDPASNDFHLRPDSTVLAAGEAGTTPGAFPAGP